MIRALAGVRLGRALLLAMVLAQLGLPGVAHAAGPLGPEGSPIRTSAYTVDLYQGPVTSSSRVIGLGGAYVAIAEGVEGLQQNPAAPAVRTPWSVDTFDYDFALGLTFPSSLRGSDFYNSGRGATDVEAGNDGLLFLNPAINFQDGPWGYGVSASLQTFEVERPSGSAGTQSNLIAQFADVNLVAAYGFSRGQLSLGVGVRTIGLIVAREDQAGQRDELFGTSGTAPVIGALFRPEDQPFRLGGSFKFRVETETDPANSVQQNADGDLILGQGAADPNAIWLPSNLRQPWEASVGVALQLGPRPLNPRWIDPDRHLANLERYLNWRSRERERRLRREQRGKSAAVRAALAADRDFAETLDDLEFERQQRALRLELVRRARELARFYVLISAELQAVGLSENSVGVESFIGREVARAGEHLSFSPRLGVESEVVPGWLKLRGGSYVEPSRFQRGSARVHGTFGLDAKLFPWTVFGLFDDGTEWRAGGAVDGARHYFSWSASVGVWH